MEWLYMSTTVLLCAVIVIIATTRLVGYAVKAIDNIRRIIVEKYVPFDPQIDKLVGLAGDYWRLQNNVERIDSKLDDSERRRLYNSLNRIKTYLEANDIEVQDFTGRQYSDGMNVNLISVEKQANIDKPTVIETRRPQISYTGIIRQRSDVIVAEPAVVTEKANPDKRKPNNRNKNAKKEDK